VYGQAIARLQLYGDGWLFCPVEFSNGRLGACHAATESLGLTQGLTDVWHAASTALPLFFMSFARPAYLYCEEYVCIYIYIYIYIHTHFCVDIGYELPMPQNNAANETFLHKSGAVLSVDLIIITGAPAWR